jgi:hypothetical protein
MRRYGLAYNMILSIALAACGGSSTDVGSDGGGSDDGSRGTNEGGGPCSSLAAAEAMLDIPAACGACLGASCCSELDACENSSACRDITLCVASCRGKGGTSASCTPECSGESDSGSATAEVDSLAACVAAHCSAVCD